MKEQNLKKLNDSRAIRWGALAIVAFTMMAAYYVNDVVAPLKTLWALLLLLVCKLKRSNLAMPKRIN